MNHVPCRRSYLDGEGALGVVGLKVDLHLSRFSACCHQFMAQFFQSITAVGDQLPDEHLVGHGREEKLEFIKLNVSVTKSQIIYLSLSLTSFSEYKDLATMSRSFFVSA